MLNVTLALRKKMRQHATPLSHKPTPRLSVQTAQARRVHIDLARLRPAAPPDARFAAGPDLQLKPAPSNQDLQANSRWPAARPAYRGGDGHTAIQVCLQHYVVITLEAGNPPALRMHDPKEPLPENCCKLPGMLESGFMPGGAMTLPVALENTVPLQDVPPILLETFWLGLSEGMSNEGRDLFAHFNAGKPLPTTATDCYRRLQAYVEWVRLLAD